MSALQQWEEPIMQERDAASGRGLTPVVGIILLVAITILLAASVAAFAFGFDESSPGQVPTVALSMEYEERAGTDDTLRLVHQSGQAVATERIAIAIDGAACVGGGTPDGRYDAATWHGGQLSAGQALLVDGTTAVCTGGDLDLSSATVRVIWVTDAGSSSQLTQWTGPG